MDIRKLDAIDHRILRALSRDGRLTNAQLAEEVGLSPSPCWQRTRRLETEGQASLEDMVKAAVALRCEEALGALFPLPAASSLDALLAQQAARVPTRRVRAPRSRSARPPSP